jgi:putative ABC transport system permease protein
VGLTWTSARYGLLVVVLALGALVLPVLGSARHTIVTYKRERARTLRGPWWQRIWLDLWLLIPAGYGTYILSQQGSILRRADDVPADAFGDPLLFLVPALSVCALALFLLRLLPLILRFLAWLAGYLRSVGVLLATRQLARAAGFYATPLGLLIVTLSLSVYTASLAATLDHHLHDQQYYLVGADASLVDLGDDPQAWLGGESGGMQSWNFTPVSTYRQIPGVEEATRVGRYEALIQTGNSYQPATYLGVDRAVLAQVAYWRHDFAPESLGALMNRLAAVQDGVLLPETFAREQLLTFGDRVNVVIKSFGQSSTVPLTYVGTLDLFPTWYPGPEEDGVLALGNLDYLFNTAMTQMPYRVWLKTGDEVDYGRLADQTFEISLGAQSVMSAPPRVQAEQSRPERQGLLGLLSVGFGSAALLAALGFVL